MTIADLVQTLNGIPALHRGRGYEWTFGLWTLSVEYDYLIIRNNDGLKCDWNNGAELFDWWLRGEKGERR